MRDPDPVALIECPSERMGAWGRPEIVEVDSSSLRSGAWDVISKLPLQRIAKPTSYEGSWRMVQRRDGFIDTLSHSRSCRHRKALFEENRPCDRRCQRWRNRVPDELVPSRRRSRPELVGDWKGGKARALSD